MISLLSERTYGLKTYTNWLEILCILRMKWSLVFFLLRKGFQRKKRFYCEWWKLKWSLSKKKNLRIKVSKSYYTASSAEMFKLLLEFIGNINYGQKKIFFRLKGEGYSKGNGNSHKKCRKRSSIFTETRNKRMEKQGN